MTISVNADVVSLYPSGVQKSVLPCGLRVITELVPSVSSAAIGLWVQVGSRDETLDHSGAAHFLEHLLFKGTTHRTARQIANEIDAVGGELNAFTGKEYTCFYVQVLQENLALGIDILCDVVINGQCKKSDVELEKSVILDEISMQNDDPEDLIGECLLSGLYGSNSLGRPIIGTSDSVIKLSARALKEFHLRWYQPERMVLAIAGNVNHDEIVSLTRRWFQNGFKHALPIPPRISDRAIHAKSKIITQYREGEQSHMSLGFAIGGRDSKNKYATMLLSTVLGGGISSRLFQKIREEKGLAYTVYSQLEHFTEVGMFTIYLACHPRQAHEVMQLTHQILTDVHAHGITKSELKRAKSSLRGALILGLEDVQSRMFRLGRHEINYGQYSDLSHTLTSLDAVTLDDMAKTIKKIFSHKPSAAFIGPVRNKKKRNKILSQYVQIC